MLIDLPPRLWFWITVTGAAMVGWVHKHGPIPFTIMCVGLAVTTVGMYHLGYMDATAEVES